MTYRCTGNHERKTPKSGSQDPEVALQMWTSDSPHALLTTASTYTSMFTLWLHLLSVLSTASPATATHNKLLDCNAKANHATILKPKLGKLVTRAGVSISFTYRNCVSVPKSKME
eukprot:6216279-Amphidinium_carterae.1